MPISEGVNKKFVPLVFDILPVPHLISKHSKISVFISLINGFIVIVLHVSTIYCSLVHVCS